MSDFFYKENIGCAFSPTINVKVQNEISPAVLSAIDNLLSPFGNMFTKAMTIKNLMQTQKMSLEGASQALSLKRTDVANKLRLLEFSEKEKSVILEYQFSEKAALAFLSLDKQGRLYAMEYCKKNGFSTRQIEAYVEGSISCRGIKKTVKRVGEGIKKFSVCDVGFFLNSIENALRLARNAGFDIQNDRSEDEECYEIHIRVKKTKNQAQS